MTFNAIIVGMPRSGTSMTTAIFSRKGYFVAEDETKELRKGDEYNPSGYWEAEPLINANTEVFQSAGFMRDNTWLYENIEHQQLLKILELKKSESHADLVQQYYNHSPWIWKDPRLCYTIGYWWQYMNPENTRVLLLKRDPKEIYQSFLRVKWRSTNKADKEDTFKRVEEHINAAELAIQKHNIPHIVIDYADFESDPTSTAKKIGDCFRMELNADELGFSSKLNNSHLSGKISTTLDRMADKLPDGLRKTIKFLVPKSLLKKIFPHR